VVAAVVFPLMVLTSGSHGCLGAQEERRRQRPHSLMAAEVYSKRNEWIREEKIGDRWGEEEGVRGGPT